jgi:agmatinase
MDFAGFDLVEVLPAYDAGQITALAAAGVTFEFLGLLAAHRMECDIGKKSHRNFLEHGL